MSKIDLLLDEENELTFQVNIEGNSPSAAKCRLRLENKDIGLLFEGDSQTAGEVSVVLPPLSNVLKEGDYEMILEVVVDDRYFEPLSFTGNFEKSIKVTAEAIVRKPKRKSTRVSAATLNETNVPIVSVKNSKTNVGKKNTKKVIDENKTNNARSKKPKPSLTDKEILRLIEAMTKKKK